MIKFGTGGWRAVIGSDFIEKNICLVAEGICALMKEEGKTDKPVMVGYDHRFLSEEAATWLAEVLAAHGVTVVIHANHLIRSAFPAMQATAKSILTHSRSKEADALCMSIKEILTLLPNS